MLTRGHKTAAVERTLFVEKDVVTFLLLGQDYTYTRLLDRVHVNLAPRLGDAGL